MANNPSFSFYVNDFEGGTRHMTDEELGCYMRLLIAQFNRGGELPNDERFLSRFCTSFRNSWPIVKEKFISQVDGKIFNQRLNIETVKKKKFLGKQGENGAKGGRPPKTQTKPTENPNETQINGTQNPNNESGFDFKNPLGNGNGIGNGNLIGIGPKMVEVFKISFPDYPIDQVLDYSACLEIAYKIADSKGWTKESVVTDNQANVISVWVKMVSFARADKWFSTRSISDLNKEFQRLIQSQTNGTHQQQHNSVNGTKLGTSEARVKKATEW